MGYKPRKRGELKIQGNREFLKNPNNDLIEVTHATLFIWNLCEGDKGSADITREYIKRFDMTSVSSDQVDKLVKSTLKELKKKGLIEYG